MTRILVLLAVLLAGGGCGLKGDLYLPETQPESGQSAPEQEDSEDEDQGSSHES